jgi:uncharacterized membrane protein
LKIENAFATILGICFFVSVSFAILSVCLMVDELSKVELLAMATSFFIGGVVTAILFVAVKIVTMHAPK